MTNNITTVPLIYKNSNIRIMDSLIVQKLQYNISVFRDYFKPSRNQERYCFAKKITHRNKKEFFLISQAQF